MSILVAIGLVALLLVPGAASRGIPQGEVVYATWMVGRRITREEWIERATWATHRIDTGGPACSRHTIVNRRSLVYYGDFAHRICSPVQRRRLRGPRDERLLLSSDLLRPQRLLRLGKARVVGSSTVDGLAAVRVEISSYRREELVDLEARTRLPLRFELYENGSKRDEWKLRYRSMPRWRLPRNFFSSAR